MKHLDQVVWVEKELKYCNAFLFVRKMEAQNIVPAAWAVEDRQATRIHCSDL